MEKITKNTRFIEFLYTLPIWVFVMPYSIILTRLIIYKFKKKSNSEKHYYYPDKTKKRKKSKSNSSPKRKSKKVKNQIIYI